MRNSIQKYRSRPSAFTLIELLLVMVILAILAAVIVPKFTGRSEQARTTRAVTDIANLKTVLQAFETDNGRFPTTAEGLNALVQKPSGNLPGWKSPYIDKLPKDPWDHDYVYRSPGNNGKEYDLYSEGGTDGKQID
jgi:general secretion pathway protein G